MDSHTFFPLLTNGETIVGKYKIRPTCDSIAFTAIITDCRLLTRTQETVCCCCHRSSYRAISLESIHRIDENFQRSQNAVYVLVWVFFLLVCSAGVLISIFAIKDTTLKTAILIGSGGLFFVINVIIWLSLCCCFRSKLIKLHGTFGSINLFFAKKKARAFEIQLSEQISQAKTRIQHTPISTIPPLSIPHASKRLTIMDQSWISTDRF
ncbi:unnamed protein product [Rotaria socialis]|uniref:Uncharacterized protein n=1 Tax=Rotaria socialis TaxID=392032 RepID=A0A821CUD0_9BILA|nr:unnamed protein product [Rotaria socialis]CAF3366926.1 unnamed protein product [Rotaria socialis]CAF3465350.1 unnamed protein product [Rotaria socialis]CAF3478899.1 unnamed protein product [Rotaria socialis]CAF3680409.1 unnamed protein product [Rotaria socialis]